ncbi:MFS transporter (plasmid) [Candidatus Megaera polyxenophila]|nr:MFS transporter [Candidatus Megaera polyxenophila]
MLGALLAIIVVYIIELLNPDLWRLGFIIGSLVGIVGVYIRIHFVEILPKDKCENALKIIKIIFNKYKTAFFAIIFLAGLNGSMCYLLLGYSQHIILKYFPSNIILARFLVLLSIATTFLSLFIFGKLQVKDDKLEKNVLKACILSMVLCVVAFILLSINNFLCTLSGMLILGFCVALLGTDLHWFIISLFPDSYRYTGTSFAFSIGMAIFGGTTPAISFALMDFIPNICLLSIYPCFLAIVFILIIKNYNN